MPDKDYDPEAEKIANSWVLFSVSLMFLLIILWYGTNDPFWTGIIAFIISSFLVVIYHFFSRANQEEKTKN